MQFDLGPMAPLWGCASCPYREGFTRGPFGPRGEWAVRHCRWRRCRTTLNAMNRQLLKVMLVEDHEVVREGLRMVLESAGDIAVVAQATTARDAIANAVRLRPDVIVMDVRLLEGNGIEATREIRSQVPRARILMLTSFQDDEALFASIMAGAGGSVVNRVRSHEGLRVILHAGGAHSTLGPA